MDLRPILAGLLGLVVFPLSQAQPRTLDLYTFTAPPYQVPDGENHVTGETVETIVCAAAHAGFTARVKLAPQNRAIHSLKRNLVDGYFAIDPSAELDAIAIRSNPVALEKWHFFTRDPELNTETARIGVVDGSNEKAWLIANGYDIFLSINSPSQLIALLKRGRIDTALMDERIMHGMRTEENAQAQSLHTHFLRYAPLYLYLSEAFTASEPEFIRQFNRSLPQCMESPLTLSAGESRRILGLARDLFTELDAAFNLQQALEAGPRLASFTDVLTIDSKWQALAPGSATDLASEILALPGSRALNAWQLNHNSLVTEILLINDMGTIAAMSQLTSDFWQGDEPKFRTVTDTKTGTPPEIYISPIHYDASTSEFQIIVSKAIRPQKDGKSTGVIALGLNIEVALRSTEEY
ncbi:hypothetical protein BKP64_18945 [Marinobacter salinus]|uniref:Uncharacterized protein n=1 Tax=Marinobacter salinus TaxID=1874317 RepID=A0A1D9GR26_9GAMM|nr:transporter substrate-binding domain-containing protein [Marinobacter salinus]AOY90069.1 hypothetical protein BKP64_18945 [Marinobacter salinus]